MTISDPTAPATADLILRNGRITTLDPSCPEAQAIALANGKVLDRGTGEEMMAHCGPQTILIDLDGRRVIPGLND
ncbi:MAG: amidohydrolase, partial [Rhodospirillaceae bacterium]